MVKIGSTLIAHHVLSKASGDRTFVKDRDLQIQVFSPFESYYASNLRTLKAVYPHFAQSKIEGNIASHQNLNGSDLKFAMEEAKNAYGMMREIQEQLNRAYQELMLLRSI